MSKLINDKTLGQIYDHAFYSYAEPHHGSHPEEYKTKRHLHAIEAVASAVTAQNALDSNATAGTSGQAPLVQATDTEGRLTAGSNPAESTICPECKGKGFRTDGAICWDCRTMHGTGKILSIGGTQEPSCPKCRDAFVEDVLENGEYQMRPCSNPECIKEILKQNGIEPSPWISVEEKPKKFDRIRVAYIYDNIAAGRKEMRESAQNWLGYFDVPIGCKAYMWQLLSALPAAPIQK